MSKKLVIIIFIQMFLYISCQNSTANIEDIRYTKGCVDSTKHIYYWSSYYSLEVYYHYYVKDIVYSNSYIDPSSKEYAYTASFHKGDSILVGYSNKEPIKSKIIKRIYIKNKNYHVP